jgi:hypothetical protein
VALSKRYAPGAAHWAAVLRGVHALAVVPIRDPLAYATAPSDDNYPSHPLPSLGAPPPGTDGLPAAEATAVRCLLLRAHFGGMTSDVSMLRAAAARWAQRFAGDAPPPPPLPPGCAAATSDVGAAASAWGCYLAALFACLPQAEHARGIPDASPAEQLAALPPLRARDIPPAAIDFHCSNIITDVLSDAALPNSAMEALHAAGEPIDVLKSAMWRFRSGVNTKARLEGGAEEEGEGSEEGGKREGVLLRRAWEGGEGVVEAHSARFIRRSFY